MDASGHPLLSYFPLARILKDEVCERFERRGEKITVVDHTLGYELRSACPTSSDMSYTRDLGHGGVRLLLDTTRDLPPGVMVALKEGDLVAVPFEAMIDPETNRTRIRYVNLDSYSYNVARAYMLRLEQSDFESPTVLAAIAEEARMTPQEFRTRFEPVVLRCRGGLRRDSRLPLDGPASPMTAD